MSALAHLTTLTAFVMVFAILPTGSAQTEAPAVVFTGHEAPDCPAGSVMCFKTDAGLATAFVAGQPVTIKLVAGGEAPHNLNFVVDGEQIATTDPAFLPGGNDASKADGASPTVEGGSDKTFTFIVPEGATKLYYWCDIGDMATETIGDHELFGMRGTVTVNPAPAAAENGTDDTNGTDPDGNATADGNVTADGNETGGQDTASGATGDMSAEAGDDNNTTADAADADGIDALLPISPWVAFAALGLTAAFAARRRQG